MNETKTCTVIARESQQIGIDTHTAHLGHDDKVRKRNISGG